MESILADLAFCGTTAIIAAIVLRRFSIPIPLPLIGVGILVAVSPWGPDFLADPELVLVALLVPLVFGEALSSSFLDLRTVRLPILVLAVVLVIATTAAIGAVGVWLAALPLAAALALGAVLAPTDAVAVSTVAKSASLPRRLLLTLEGESLANDGTGLTLLRVAVIVAMAGGISVAEVGGVFAIAVAVGVCVGAVAGWTVIQILKRTQDALATNALTLVAPFAIYLGTEELGGSGILAIVVAALWIAHGQHAKVSATTRIQAVYVWKHVNFALQAIAFFAIGLELPVVLQQLPRDESGVLLMLSMAALVCLISVRFLVVFAMEGIPRIFGNQDSKPWIPAAIIMAWAGARGPISGLAAFSLPMVITSGSAFPGRDLLIGVTLIVIVVTLLLSLTLAPLARRLGVSGEATDELTGRIDAQLARAVLIRLDAVVAAGETSGNPVDPAVAQRLRDDARRRIERDSTNSTHVAHGRTYSSQLNHLKRELIEAEYGELVRIRDEEAVPDAIIRPLMMELDVRLQALRAQRH